MIRLGLRLTLGSGREAAQRVLVVAAAVALGVGLLLAALAGDNGLHAQTDRGAWLDTSAQASQPASGTSASNQLWWLSSVDQFGSQAIDRVDVAAAGPNAPVPPGIAHLPGPGEYDASPALATLIASQPADELRERFPGRQIGTIGAAALPSPNSLIIVIGHTARQLSRAPGAVEVGAIQRTLANCYHCQNPIGSGPVLQWILAGGAVFLLLPVLILIATASRLSAVRREQRFAAMRLIGATPRQVSVVSAVEAAVAALAGVAVGFALFFVVRPLLYHVPFTGAPFAPGDLSLHGIDIVLSVIGVPVAAVVSARLALRRVQISPLGVTRRVSSRPPRFVRIIPLVTGIALLAYFDAHGKPGSNGGQLLELLVGFVLLVVGLVLAGPWFTTAGARLMTTRASRPATLLAGRRLLDNPRAAFRFISGLVIALFVASALIGALSSIAFVGSSGGGTAGKDTLAEPFCGFSTTNCPASAQVPSVPGQVLAELHATAGVSAVTVVHQNPSSAQPQFGFSGAQSGRSFGVVACDQLAKTPAIGTCAPGEAVASIGYFFSNLLGHNSHASTTTWPSAPLSAAATARLPVDAVVVATDGSSGAIERARTILERAFPFQGQPLGVETLDPSNARLLTMIQDMTDVIIVASLIIAACSLAVNVAAGLGERKRPFSLLRLTGVPTALLHRVSPWRVHCRCCWWLRCRSSSAWCRPPSTSTPRWASPSASQDGVLGHRPRRSGGVAGDHRLDVPTSQSDHRARGRPQRLTPPGDVRRVPSLPRGAMEDPPPAHDAKADVGIEGLGPVVVVSEEIREAVARSVRQPGGVGHQLAGQSPTALLGHGVDVLHAGGEAVHAQLGDRRRRPGGTGAHRGAVRATCAPRAGCTPRARRGRRWSCRRAPRRTRPRMSTSISSSRSSSTATRPAAGGEPRTMSTSRSTVHEASTAAANAAPEASSSTTTWR